MSKKAGRFLIIVLLFVFFIPPPAIGADASCGLAKKIGEQAIQKFKKDKKEGLRLLIKAHDLCSGDATLAFNLGLAYYRYGNLTEAEKYLTTAVEKEGNQGEWLNLLAWVMMENRSDRGKALEYAKKAEGINPASAAVAETLTRAYLENGQLYNAVSYGHKVRNKWSGDRQIATRYDNAVDAYIAHYLKKSKEKNHQEAIAGLKKADFEPEIVNAYCWALSSAGKTEEALAATDAAISKFRGEASLTETFDRIMDGYIQSQYRIFKAGKRSDAVMAVDGMKKKYPSHKGLRETYDKMLNAVLAEADTIVVPEPMKIASDRKKTGAGATLLSELQAGGGQGSDSELTVDVDRDIPRGAAKNRQGIAVIIGNGAYGRSGHGIPDVDYAARDAAYMKEYVINVLGYNKDNVIYKLNVTQGDLARLFGTGKSHRGQLFNWVKAGQADVFVYYVGHGAPEPAGKGAFLMPVDADADYIAASGYPLDTFYDNLERIPAKSITVVIDACFSGDSGGGMLVKNVSPAMLKTASTVRNVANAVVFTSAGKDQVSHWYPEKRHSLFTYFFMKGLRGEADTNRNNVITVGEMKDYLKEQVPYRARRMSGREQTPVVVGDANHVIARLR